LYHLGALSRSQGCIRSLNTVDGFEISFKLVCEHIPCSVLADFGLRVAFDGLGGALIIKV
jgi:hypothetical protein